MVENSQSNFLLAANMNLFDIRNIHKLLNRITLWFMCDKHKLSQTLKLFQNYTIISWGKTSPMKHQQARLMDVG